MKSFRLLLILALSLSAAFCQAAAPAKTTAPAGNTPQGPACHCKKKTSNGSSPKKTSSAVSKQPTPAPPAVQTVPQVVQVQSPPNDQMTIVLRILADTQNTNAKALAIQAEALKEQTQIAGDRLWLVEVPAQETNQFRAKTERELADAKVANDARITTAQVNLMNKQGTAAILTGTGNLFSGALSPLTGWLGRSSVNLNSVNNATGMGGNSTNSNSNVAEGGKGGNASSASSAASQSTSQANANAAASAASQSTVTPPATAPTSNTQPSTTQAAPTSNLKQPAAANAAKK